VIVFILFFMFSTLLACLIMLKKKILKIAGDFLNKLIKTIKKSNLSRKYSIKTRTVQSLQTKLASLSSPYLQSVQS